MSTVPSITQVFAGKSIFITGATGFFGKTLIEKLLRDCQDVADIYVLIRPSKDKDPHQRTEEIFKGVLFDAIRRKDPQFERHIKVIPGDLSKPNMGVQPDNPLLTEMMGKVSFVFHCAATVNFNERLDTSLNTNVLSVYNLMRLARGLKKLEALVHVSTAYSHSDRQHIEEKFYPPTYDPLALVKVAQSLPEDALAAITPLLVAKRPNTYTFTKSLAEAVVKEESKGMPVAVVRPSVVGCLAGDPLPGWSDNANGPASIYLAVGHGILRAGVANGDATFDMVPVDYCINMILAVAWHLAVKKPHLLVPTSFPPSDPSKEIQSASVYPEPLVYNCVSSNIKPMNLGFHNHLLQELVLKNPMSQSWIRRAHFSVVTEKQFKYFYQPLYHTIPAIIIDLFRRLQGKKPMMVKIYKRVDASITNYAFFTTQQWLWDDANSRQLIKEMSEEDRKTFSLDLSNHDWTSYITTYYDGCKKYLVTARPPKSSGTASSSPSPSSSSASFKSDALNSQPSTPSLSVLNTPLDTPTLTPSASSENLQNLNGQPHNQSDNITSSSNHGSQGSGGSSRSSTKSKSLMVTSAFSWQWTTALVIVLAVLGLFLWDLLFEDRQYL